MNRKINRKEKSERTGIVYLNTKASCLSYITNNKIITKENTQAQRKKVLPPSLTAIKNPLASNFIEQGEYFQTIGSFSQQEYPYLHSYSPIQHRKGGIQLQ